MRDLACRWLIVENTKIFRSYAKYFWIFPREKKCRILIGLCKGKLVPAAFFYFLELLWEKNKF